MYTHTRVQNTKNLPQRLVTCDVILTSLCKSNLGVLSCAQVPPAVYVAISQLEPNRSPPSSFITFLFCQRRHITQPLEARLSCQPASST
jgi:hypothetical protein